MHSALLFVGYLGHNRVSALCIFSTDTLPILRLLIFTSFLGSNYALVYCMVFYFGSEGSNFGRSPGILRAEILLQLHRCRGCILLFSSENRFGTFVETAKMAIFFIDALFVLASRLLRYFGLKVSSKLF